MPSARQARVRAASAAAVAITERARLPEAGARDQAASRLAASGASFRRLADAAGPAGRRGVAEERPSSRRHAGVTGWAIEALYSPIRDRTKPEPCRTHRHLLRRARRRFPFDRTQVCRRTSPISRRRAASALIQPFVAHWFSRRELLVALIDHDARRTFCVETLEDARCSPRQA